MCCHHHLIQNVCIILASVEWERYKMIYMYIEALKTKGTNESAKFKNGKQTRKGISSTNYMHCCCHPSCVWDCVASDHVVYSNYKWVSNALSFWIAAQAVWTNHHHLFASAVSPGPSLCLCCIDHWMAKMINRQNKRLKLRYVLF